MATPREFKKKLWFPYVFASFAFLCAITHTVYWMIMEYDFSLYMFFTYVFTDLSYIATGVCLILFGRKKAKDTIIPISIILGARIIDFSYLMFKYSGQSLTQNAIFAGVDAGFVALILLFYVLIILGKLRERTILIILGGMYIALECGGFIYTLWPWITHQYYSNNFLIVTLNVLGFLSIGSEAVLSTLTLYYVFSLKKIEPKVIKIALTMQEKIAMIDKLYLMFQKGEITEAEYIEKKKELLKEI